MCDKRAIVNDKVASVKDILECHIRGSHFGVREDELLYVVFYVLVF